MSRRPAILAHVAPPVLGDGTLERAGELMGLRENKMRVVLPLLMGRGFPGPDETTGLFDLDAIVRWRQLRNAPLYGLNEAVNARSARDVVARRLEAMNGPST